MASHSWLEFVVLLNVEGFKQYCIVLNMYNHELLFLFQGRVLHLKMQSKLNAGFCTSIVSEVKERTTHGSSLVNTKSLFIIMSITKVYTSRLYKHQHNETWEIPSLNILAISCIMQWNYHYLSLPEQKYN